MNTEQRKFKKVIKRRKVATGHKKAYFESQHPHGLNQVRKGARSSRLLKILNKKKQ